MKFCELLDIRLNLFDGGAAGGGESGGATAPGQDGASGKGETLADPGHTRRGGTQDGSRACQKDTGRRGTSGETGRVLYGKQPEAAAAAQARTVGQPPDAGEDGGRAGEQSAPQAAEEKRRAYRELVEGEFKDQYIEDTQRIINQRFKETARLREQLQKNQPVLDMLMQRYKIADGDPAKLMAAVESDDAYWSQAAEEAGMSVEQYKRFQKLQRENAALREFQRRSQAREQSDRQLQQWDAEAAQVKTLYPSFDLGAEAQNPQFLAMLRSGVPVRHAYEVVHMEEIKAGIAAMQARATEKQVVDGIRAKGVRPAENGTAGQSAFTIKDDVSKLSRKDRAEIARRVARGETIMF